MTTSSGAQADRCAAAAATGQQRPQPQPWQQLLGGLQRNCQQFAANLSRVQQQACAQLQVRRPARQAQSISLPVASLSQAAAPAGWSGGSGSGAAGSAAGSGVVTREEVGRATWTFLHTLAAQYPEKPTRQQRRDARNLVSAGTGEGQPRWGVHGWVGPEVLLLCVQPPVRTQLLPHPPAVCPTFLPAPYSPLTSLPSLNPPSPLHLRSTS